MLRSRLPLRLLAAVALGLPGCGGDDGTPTVVLPTGDTGDSSDVPDDPLLDSGWPAGDIGNLHLAYHVNSGRSEVFGMVLSSSPGFYNYAQCMLTQTPCYGGIPVDEGTPVPMDPDDEVDEDTVTTRYLGPELRYGPFTMNYREDPQTRIGYYALDTTGQEMPVGKIGAAWEGGQWDARQSNNDIEVSPPIELQSPPAGRRLFLVNDQVLPIEWVPTGKGQVTLSVATPFSLFNFYKLEDDGYFELDVSSLGLTEDLESLTFVLTRWDEAEVDFQGHIVRMLATSDVSFTADYANIGARDPLYVVDECNEARGMPPLVSGQYWAKLDGFDASLNPTWVTYPGCLRETGNFAADAGGIDGLLKVVFPPKSNLNLEYTHLSESASVYLLTNCQNAGTCEIGIDADDGSGAPERLSRFNASDDTETLYLVLDSTSNSDNQAVEVFTLDVTLESLIDPEMHDFCSDAENAPETLITAGYYEEFVAYTGDMNPGAGSCTFTSMPGPEAMMPVTLPAGSTLTATVEMEGGNAGVYLVTDCGDPAFSCLVGSDISLSGREQIVYENDTGAALKTYLVVDSADGLRPFVLGVTIE